MSSDKFLLVILAMSVGACSAPRVNTSEVLAQPAAAGGASASTHSWQTGAYEIRFAAGPRKWLPEGGQKSFSTYAVTCTREGQPPLNEVATSAVDIESFIYNPSLKATDIIKVFVSPSGRHVLISEIVPNDCAPCSNFILFENTGEELKACYLQMPGWFPPTKPNAPPAPVFEEEATILSLTDEEIEFEYSNKKPKRLRIRDIPKKERETYPG